MPDPTDTEYFTKRAKESRLAAADAHYAGSTGIHTTLANAYDGLAHDAEDPHAVRDQPSKVVAVDGQVRMEGPSEETIAFTPNAARLTADSLMRGANQAGD